MKGGDVEVVARAMCAAFGDKWIDKEDQLRAADYLSMAEAAIETMRRVRCNNEGKSMPDEFDQFLTTISLHEWIKAKTAYTILRVALCDIEGGVADTIQEARFIAKQAVRSTPPYL